MVARDVARGLWRLPFESSTLPPFDHTNGWVITDGPFAAVVDPGFRTRGGLEMLRATLVAARAPELVAILLTHTHNDHCEGLPAVRAAWPEAEIWVHVLEADRLPVSHRMRRIAEDEELGVGGRSLRALHTPGHSPGHLAWSLPDVGWVLAGDLVAGRGSVWVGAPEGDVAAYLASLDRVRRERPRILGPGHGEPRMDGEAALLEARDHRLQREAQVLSVLQESPRPLSLPALRARVYPALDPSLGALAERTLAAHLVKLVAEGRALAVEAEGRDPSYRAAG